MTSLLIEQIKQLFPDLSPAKKEVAQYLTEHWREASFMSAAQLGKEAGVSESVVIRFAQQLGFNGYPRLQEELQKLVNERLTLVGRFERSSGQTESSTLIEQVLEVDSANISALLLDNSSDSLDQAVEMISGANRIGVVSFGPTSTLAIYLATNLNQALNNCLMIDLGLGEWLDRIRQFGSGDLIIAASFPRYGREVCDMLSIAKAKGATGLAITDSLLSPIAGLADHTLIARTDGASFNRTLTACITLSNLLLAMVANREKDRVRLSLEEKDRLLHLRKAPCPC